MRALLVGVVVAAACSGNGSGRIDSGAGDDTGGDGDADVDAMVDADPNVRGPVTVTIADRRGSPVPGMHVVFVDTDSTVTDVVTDSAGSASASVFPNASVTAIRERDSGLAFQLTTVLALNPGDTIRLIAEPGNVASADDTFTQGLVPLPAYYLTATTKSASTGTFTTSTPHGLAVGDSVVVADVSVAAYNGAWTVTGTPSTTSFTANLGSGGASDGVGGTAAKADRFTVNYSAYGGAAYYEVDSPCGATDTLATNPVILLRAGCVASTMDLVVLAKNSGGSTIAWTSTTGVAFTPNGSTTVTAAWQTPSAITATYTNVPAQVSNIALRRMAPYVREPAVSTSGAVSAGGATLMVNASLPAQAAMHSRFTCTSGTGCVSTMAQQTLTQLVDGTQTGYALDVGANLLPWLTALWDPPTTTMQVGVTGTASYDLFQGAIRYTRGQVSQVIYTWRVFGPTAGTFKFPTLPSTVPGDPTIRVNDPQASYVVGVCESDAINGYRDAIENVYEAYGTCLASSSPTIVRFGGTLNRLSQSK